MVWEEKIDIVMAPTSSAAASKSPKGIIGAANNCFPFIVWDCCTLSAPVTTVKPGEDSEWVLDKHNDIISRIM